MATNGQTQNTSVSADLPVSPTEYDQKSTLTRTVTEHHNGHQVNFEVDQDVETELSGSFDDRVMAIVKGAIEEREKRENIRANHRNLNRMLTLFAALAIGLVVTYVLTHNGIPGLVTLPSWAKSWAPYTFVITIALDSGLALYGFIRHY